MAISSALGSSALLPAGLGFRNVIMNGDFRINQRGFTSATTGGFSHDRWIAGISGDGTTTHSVQNFTLGNAIAGQEPEKYHRIVTSGQTSAAVESFIWQNMENVRTFAGQTATLSFWARSGSGTPSVAIEIQQYFGAGGSPSATVSTPIGKVVLSTTWTRHSITMVVPSISGKTLGTDKGDHLRLFMFVSAGSNFNTRTGSLGIQSNTFEFWGVQFEQNYQPTPFEQRPIGVELELCQRYYHRMIDPVGVGVSQGSGGGSARVTIPFYTKMRATPTSTMGGTLNFYNGAVTVTATSIAASQNSVSHGQFDFAATFATVGQAIVLYTTGGSQYIDFSAEL
jgi:hypothetical protein